jgi:hypothetical protein
MLVGWVFGTGWPVTGVELLHDDGIVERIPLARQMYRRSAAPRR